MTIGTKDRQEIFGHVGVVREQPKMVLNKIGKIVESVWLSLPQHHLVQLDAFQIMPNHVHGIMVICRGFARKTPTHGVFGHVESGSLSCIIRSFKSEITKQIRIMINDREFPVWQRNFYEHIIRNEKELSKIREYILLNPNMWKRDRNNPENLPTADAPLI